MLTGRILITGGAGYLGRSILRRIERDGWPVEVTIYSRGEHAQDEVRKRWPHVRRILGDVQNFDRLRSVLTEQRYDLIIHAGALKHIPEGEENVFEIVDVNVNGSRTVAMAALAAGVPTVVGLSTDKSCGPLNTYGMTKALMERIFGEANRYGVTRFALVRYGNVVSSTGSVVPLFREQVARTGRVQLTDPGMTRFWLTMDDAIDLIVTAANNAAAYPGGVFVPRCGAMKVVELAAAAVGEHVPVDVVGLRAGEKLHETLLLPVETLRARPVLTRVGGRLPVIVVLRPTEKVAEDYPWAGTAYSSDEPDHWIDRVTMRQWIDDAATI